MSGILDDVDQRTQLAGHNRLELLLFELNNGQVFGINVFKVREAIPCPALTQMPESHPVVCGIAHIRGQTLSIFDLAMGVGQQATDTLDNKFVIITEYNRSIQGFLVKKINRIINTSWSEILPTPPSTGENFLTAITKVDDKIIEIIDVEKVLADVIGTESEVSHSLIEDFSASNDIAHPLVLVADDSNVARKQIARTLKQINIDCVLVNDGQQAIDYITQCQQEGLNIHDHIALIISDIEMPEMDGYSLTTHIRNEPALQAMPILLHSSMSGDFNRSLTSKVGANQLIGKFDADELATTVQKLIEPWKQRTIKSQGVSR